MAKRSDMRALVAHAIGEPADVLEEQTRPIPSPGPGQALVRVHATPVHASDLHTIRGRYGLHPTFPLVPGVEAVGTVTALGDRAGGLSVGQRVVTLGVPGTWQDFLVADAERLLPIPDKISTSTAAQLIVNPLTALLLVRDELNLQPGQWLVQTAANSTVGRLVVQLSQIMRFRTINVVRRREAAASLRAFGGDDVICTEDEDIATRIAEITRTGGVSMAIDAVAGEVGAEVFRALEPGGKMIAYAALSTHRQTDPAALTIPLPAQSLIYGGKSIHGFWLVWWFMATPTQQMRQTLTEIIDLVTERGLEIPEGRPFPPSAAGHAIAAAEAPAHGAKPLLTWS
jgi:NADPH:quinone reductase-like Zn-dependent oxidoreductase